MEGVVGTGRVMMRHAAADLGLSESQVTGAHEAVSMWSGGCR